MAAHKIRRDDKVIILSGKDKGKTGTVKYMCYPKNRAVISGINMIKKHQKPVPDRNKPGGIIEKETSIDLSNIAVFNPVLKKADKVKFKIKNGKKIRVFKSDESIIT